MKSEPKQDCPRIVLSNKKNRFLISVLFLFLIFNAKTQFLPFYLHFTGNTILFFSIVYACLNTRRRLITFHIDESEFTADIQITEYNDRYLVSNRSIDCIFGLYLVAVSQNENTKCLRCFVPKSDICDADYK